MRASAPALPPELMVWLSPAFPVGSFAYSQGLEQAAERGWVSDCASLCDWIAATVKHGALRNDLILLTAAWRAAHEIGDGSIFRVRGPSSSSGVARKMEPSPISAINDLAIALQPSAERHLETTLQGNAFLAAIAAAWPAPGTQDAGHSMIAALDADVAYPVAVGTVAAAHGIALDSTLMAYAVAAVTNLTSAAIRLSVIGQTDAQRIIADLMPLLAGAVSEAARSTPDDLGSATFAADIASLAHETQYTRLFRS